MKLKTLFSQKLASIRDEAALTRTAQEEQRKPSNAPGDAAPSALSLVRCSTAEARALIPYSVASRFGVLPLGLFDRNGQRFLTIAAAPPHSGELAGDLRFVCGMEVRLLEIEGFDLPRAVFAAYHGDEDQLISGIQTLKRFDRLQHQSSRPSTVVEFRPEKGDVSKFVAQIVDYAISHRASDIHLIPTRDGTYVQLRLNGELLNHDQALSSLDTHQQIVNRIKVLARLDTTQRQIPQDGRFQVPVNGVSVDIRVSSMPTLYGEKMVLRLHGTSGLIPLQALGLDETTLSFLERQILRLSGAILFAGPTGSGKSTTMYAILDSLRSLNLSLVSVEDPVELSVSGVAQSSIDTGAGLDFPVSLRAVLRQDPDVILIGEIRDRESASIACQAALSGHLILSSVHARNAAEILMRLEHFGIDRLTLIQALELLICQRLLPVLCTGCKAVDVHSSRHFGYEIFQSVGCEACAHSGYAGQMVIAESLYLDNALKELILSQALSIAAIREGTSSLNYHSLQTSLAEALQAGKISARDYSVHSAL